MLILTRKLDEEIRIGDDIVIKITKLMGSQVAIGITAPKAIPVNRQEVYERIQKQQKSKQQLYRASA